MPTYIGLAGAVHHACINFSSSTVIRRLDTHTHTHTHTHRTARGFDYGTALSLVCESEEERLAKVEARLQRNAAGIYTSI